MIVMRNEIIVLLVAPNHHNANSEQNLANGEYKIFTLWCVCSTETLALTPSLCFIPLVSTLLKNKITLHNISTKFCKIVKVSSRKIQ